MQGGLLLLILFQCTMILLPHSNCALSQEMLEVHRNREDKQVRTQAAAKATAKDVLVPLEFKTGKPHISHRAQVKHKELCMLTNHCLQRPTWFEACVLVALHE